MITKDIMQTTEISVTFAQEISNESCDKLIETVCEMIYDNLDTKNHSLEYDYKKVGDGEYTITFTESGTVRYYPSNDWYEPDDWDEPTTLSEDDFEDAISDVKYDDAHASKYEEECNLIDSIYISECGWEEC